jgi:hypothetical protein
MDVMVIPNRVKVVAVMAALALAAGLLTLALLTKPMQAKPSTINETKSEQFPVHFIIDGTGPGCFGELIEITGTLHTVNHFRGKRDPEGNPVGPLHANSHFNLMNVKGVGQTTGDVYVIPNSGGAVENVVPNGDIVTGTVDINMIISKGSSPNQNGFSRVHYILTEDGIVKAEVIQFHFKCTGPGGPTFPSASASASATATAKAQPQP